MKDGPDDGGAILAGGGWPKALTVAGSDSGGGAGIQADLKTFMAFGVYGMSAITAVTAQNTLGIGGIHLIPPEMVAAQMEAVWTDMGADAVKTGMLGSPEIVAAVAESLRRHGVRNLVVDPVIYSTSGHRLLSEEAQERLARELLPMALLVTPNLMEAEILAGRKIRRQEDLEYAAKKILALGPKWVLIKGGHRDFDSGSEAAIDFLTDGTMAIEIRSRRIDTQNTHGTGCTLSAAIAAGLSLGLTVAEAAGSAKEYLTGALETARKVGRGQSPVNHWYRAGR